jgi:glucoamylase
MSAPGHLPLEAWIERQYRHAATQMLRSVSPVGIIKLRPGFDQEIRPVRGAIVASPVPASYDPDPDYFFHWFRDSAVVVDALRLLHADGTLGEEAMRHLHDFVAFSLALEALDGRALVTEASWRGRVTKDFQKFLRTDEDLAGAWGDRIPAETRVNPDGTLDISSWPRPQHDGPAMRAITLLRWARSATSMPEDDAAALARLIEHDLDFCLRHWSLPAFDIWEEEEGLHYYSLRLADEAMREGADWLDGRSKPGKAEACRAARRDLAAALDAFWRADEGVIASRRLSSGERSRKELDSSVILGAIHASRTGRGLDDPRLFATLDRLEAHFRQEYAINHGLTADEAPALGRYPGDTYYSGGAYFFSTLAAAELLFKAACDTRDGERRRTLLARGDRYLETVRRHLPESGDMAEQFDQSTGEPASARHLAWSYAGFISAVAARRSALSRA